MEREEDVEGCACGACVHAGVVVWYDPCVFLCHVCLACWDGMGWIELLLGPNEHGTHGRVYGCQAEFESRECVSRVRCA